jgi:hypothetical protein
LQQNLILLVQQILFVASENVPLSLRWDEKVDPDTPVISAKARIDSRVAANDDARRPSLRPSFC